MLYGNVKKEKKNKGTIYYNYNSESRSAVQSQRLKGRKHILTSFGKERRDNLTRQDTENTEGK